MKKFREWLDKTPGLATQLRQTIETNVGHSVNATCVSNVKHERRLMPTSWMPTVVKMSKGFLSSDYLVHERNRVERALKRSAA